MVEAFKLAKAMLKMHHIRLLLSLCITLVHWSVWSSLKRHALKTHTFSCFNVICSRTFALTFLWQVSSDLLLHWWRRSKSSAPLCTSSYMSCEHIFTRSMLLCLCLTLTPTDRKLIDSGKQDVVWSTDSIMSITTGEIRFARSQAPLHTHSLGVTF